MTRSNFVRCRLMWMPRAPSCCRRTSTGRQLKTLPRQLQTAIGMTSLRCASLTSPDDQRQSRAWVSDMGASITGATTAKSCGLANSRPRKRARKSTACRGCPSRKRRSTRASWVGPSAGVRRVSDRSVRCRATQVATMSRIHRPKISHSNSACCSYRGCQELRLGPSVVLRMVIL